MKLFYFKSPKGLKNFGDELNAWLWNKIFPSAFDHEDGTLFVGIGTILNENIPRAERTLVFGSGVGYGALPKRDKNWKFYCVRGPKTAEALNISPNLAVSDSALLVRNWYKRNGHKKFKFSYMPHYQHAVACDASIKTICDELGFAYIDPRSPIEEVLCSISSSECLISEALHGAVVADTLRTSWIPVVTTDEIFSFKWEDWCASMEISYIPNRVLPLWNITSNSDRFARARYAIKKLIVRNQLKNIARKAKPFLSKESVLNEKLEILGTKCEEVKKDMAEGFSNLQTAKATV